MHRKQGLSERNAGFSMLELMVALTVGGIAITSIYAVGAASSRTFQQQQQIATTQTALRMAVNQVKRDIARAGYLATPNVQSPGQSCGGDEPGIDNPGGSGRLAAFSNYQNDVILTNAGPDANTGIDPTGNNRQNGFTTDEVVLFANYETASDYSGLKVPNPSRGNELTLEQSWQSFTKDFTTWYRPAGVYDPAAFQDAFRVGRLARVYTPRRMRHFSRIASTGNPIVVGAPVPFTLNQAIPPSCVDDANQGSVAPVSAIRYFARNATGNEAERFNTTDPVAQLIRQEVQPDDKRTPLIPAVGQNAPGNTRAVVDYLVAFNLAFTMTDITPPQQPDNYVLGATVPGRILAGNAAAAAVNANPETIRAVTIDLAVRAPQVDPTLPWTQLGCSGLLDPRQGICFQVSTQYQAAARVRRMRAEVFVPNVAFEGY